MAHAAVDTAARATAAAACTATRTIRRGARANAITVHTANVGRGSYWLMTPINRSKIRHRMNLDEI